MPPVLFYFRNYTSVLLFLFLSIINTNTAPAMRMTGRITFVLSPVEAPGAVAEDDPEASTVTTSTRVAPFEDVSLPVLELLPFPEPVLPVPELLPEFPVPPEVLLLVDENLLKSYSDHVASVSKDSSVGFSISTGVNSIEKEPDCTFEAFT